MPSDGLSEERCASRRTEAPSFTIAADLAGKQKTRCPRAIAGRLQGEQRG